MLFGLLNSLAYALFITLTIILVINVLICLLFDTYRDKCKRAFNSNLKKMNLKKTRKRKDIELDTIAEKRASFTGLVLEHISN